MGHASGADWLRHRRVLLVVDNCEHVLGPAADLVAAINAECATVTVLATSREPLGLRGERVHVVPSLDPPAEGAQLFRDRAVAADASFDAQPDDTGVIETICTRLDGIPLAIELAAARTRSLAPADLLARLDDRFRLLRGAGRGGLERHQTLRATVAWSYQLLTAGERKVFDRASVFAGPFDLAAAEQVCAGDDVDLEDVLDLLTSLCRQVDGRRNTSSRVHPLPVAGDTAPVRRGAPGGQRRVHSHPRSPPRPLRLGCPGRTCARVECAPGRRNRLFEDAWDNLRGAFNWAIAGDQIVLASTIVHGSYRYSNDQQRSEHREWSERLLPIAESDRSVLLRTLGICASWSFIDGMHDRAIELANVAIELCPDLDEPDVARSWFAYAIALMASGRSDRRIVPVMRVIAASHPDLSSRVYACYHLVSNIAGETSGQLDEIAAQASAYAEQAGAPSLIALAATLQAAWRPKPNRLTTRRLPTCRPTPWQSVGGPVQGRKRRVRC